jgi:peptidyl-prolyl cis-trans isomerase A (cyclophilin A)
MRLFRIALAVSPLVLSIPACAAQTGKSWMAKAEAGKDIWATLQTNKGTIVVKLFSKDAPKTVSNFVGLASGEKEWTDPRDGRKKKTPLYDGTEFHRVIPNFMIQGGDAEGTGRGQPGFTIEDEFQSGRKFDKKGLLAMANRGPNTNGSQFFITTSTPPRWQAHHLRRGGLGLSGGGGHLPGEDDERKSPGGSGGVAVGDPLGEGPGGEVGEGPGGEEVS